MDIFFEKSFHWPNFLSDSLMSGEIKEILSKILTIYISLERERVGEREMVGGHISIL